MRKKIIRNISLLVLLTALSFAHAAAADNSPTADLKPVLDKMMAVLSDKSLQGDENLLERRKKIMSSIKDGFDFREMSKRVLGRKWRDINDQQRDHFTELMTTLLENVYIGKLEKYSNQTVEFKAEKIKGSRAQVSTVIENEGTKIPVHYIMKKNGDRWKVYDINIEGVSLVRNYQQQFKSILRKEKYEGLVKVLEEKNKSFKKTEN